jgi:preprotein translocase subunit SecG
MYGFLLAVLILDAIFLSVVILLQAGKGGGLAAMGGGAAATDGILGGRQATTVLTRATWTSGTLFMVLSLVLSIMSSRSAAPSSILRPDLPASTAPAPVLPGLDDAGTAPAGEGGTGGETGAAPEGGADDAN